MSAVDVKQATATTLGRAHVRPISPPKTSVWQQIWRDRVMLLFVLPGVLYFVLFRYVPLLGNVIAFEDYLPFIGFESPFVGFANFQGMVQDAAFWQAVSNTILIALMQLVFYFPAPICLALSAAQIAANSRLTPGSLKRLAMVGNTGSCASGSLERSG